MKKYPAQNDHCTYHCPKGVPIPFFSINNHPVQLPKAVIIDWQTHMINEDYFESWHRLDLFSKESKRKCYSICNPTQSNRTRCGVRQQTSKQADQKTSRKGFP
jgi:hypothetical protein